MEGTQAQQRADGTGRLSLVRKLAEVMGEVERVAKSGRNEFHKYDYATEADIVASVREHMAKRALMLVPDVADMKLTEVPRKNGGSDRLVTLKVRFTVHDGESGEQLGFDVYGEGQDAGDKATYKALTGATKYALLKLFLIPTGDDPEQDEPQQKGRGQQSQGNQRQQGHGQGQQRPYGPQQQGERRAQPTAQAPRDARPDPAAQQERPALVAHGGDIIGVGKWAGTKLSEAKEEDVRACLEDIKAMLASDKPVHNAELLRATQTVLAKHLVSKQAEKQGPRQEPEVTFGPLKGKKIATLTDKELQGVYDQGNQKLQAPGVEREPWYSALKKTMGEVEAEVALRERRAKQSGQQSRVERA